MKSDSGKLLNGIISFLLYLLVFLMPVFFTLKTSEYFEFNKQYLLFLFIPTIFFAFFLKKLLIDKRITIYKTPLDVPIITFLLVYFIASIFSIDKVSSFFGYYDNISNSFFVVFFLWLFYFLLNNLGFASEKHRLLKTLIYSSGMVVIIYLLSYLEILNKIFPPLNIYFENFINLLGGSDESLSVYFSILIILLFGYIYYAFKRDNIWVNKYELFVFKLFIFLFLIALIILKTNISFVILLIGACFYFLFEFKFKGLRTFRLNEKKLFLYLFIIISVIFLVLINRSVLSIIIEDDFALDYENSYLVSYQAIKDNPVIGTGPSTFAYSYSQYRESSLNYDNDWQSRFNKPAFYLLEIFVSSGIAGILAYLLILSILVELIIFYFLKYLSHKDYHLVAPVLISIILFVFLHFVINFSLILLFLFWFLLSLLVAEFKDVEMPGYNSNIVLVGDKKKYVLLFIILMILLFTWAGFMIKSGKYWLEDYYYKIGDESSLSIVERLDTNKFSYKIKLSKYYLNKLKIELEKPINLQNREVIQLFIDNALKYAQKAKVLQPYSVLTNEALGMVYRDIKYLGEGGSIEAINAFEDAINLEPSNPVLYTELGKEYLYINMVDEATISFYKALGLKEDFHEAKFGLAKVLVTQEKYNEALKILDELSKIYNDAEIFFEKGRLYYNQGESEKAIDNFMNSVKLDPLHYDALYGLAVVYDEKGERSLAHDYLEKALRINPDLNKD